MDNKKLYIYARTKLFTIIQIYLFGNEKKNVTLNTAAEKITAR